MWIFEVDLFMSDAIEIYNFFFDYVVQFKAYLGIFWVKRVLEELFNLELAALQIGYQTYWNHKILVKGIIWLRGRLQFAEFTYKDTNPVILDGNRHHFGKQLINNMHIKLHHCTGCTSKIFLDLTCFKGNKESYPLMSVL